MYASWEDTVVAFMAPRSGKTTAQAVPFVLSAPGRGHRHLQQVRPVGRHRRAARRATGGQVWLFDPQRITYQPQTWWWDLLRGLRTVEDAHRLAGHFVLTVADENRRDLWGPAAQDLLAALFLAAASSGHTLHEVAGWLNEPAVPTPIELLADAGFTAMAASLRGAQNGAAETRDGIYQTARTAAKAMTDPEIMAWVTPPRRGTLPVFDPDDFAASRDTLYLLSKSRSAAAPLIAALSDTAMRAAERRAERLGGRLDPPLVVPLDEAANICRIADLPDLYSHLGSRGITPVTILQSYEQGVTVWGEHGMATLWGAATKKIIGAGVDSPRLARDLATLVGQHDVPVRTINYGDGRASESVSLRRQDILEPAAIRALPPGTALLLATGIKPALIHLTPWYAGPRAAEITAAHRRPRRSRSASRRSKPTPGTATSPPTHRSRSRDDRPCLVVRSAHQRQPPSFPAEPPGDAAPRARLTADRQDGHQPPEPVYTAVEDWVIDYFLPMFRRTLGGEFRWCGQWWRHGEAISRLTCPVARLGSAAPAARHRDRHLVPRPPRPPAADPDGRPRPLLPVQRNRPPRTARGGRHAIARRMVGRQPTATTARRQRAGHAGWMSSGPVTTVTDPYPAGLDPAHILAICTHATGGRPGLAVGARDGMCVCLPSRRAARSARAALARVGYRVTDDSGPRGRDLVVTGWNPAGLESRLNAMRVVLHQLAENPSPTARAVIERFRSLPGAAQSPRSGLGDPR